MNLSGGVVAKFASFYKIEVKDILVIQDDLDMKVGRIKIVTNSSSGVSEVKDLDFIVIKPPSLFWNMKKYPK